MFITDSHLQYLQQQRAKGHVGTIVTNPHNGEEIDTRVFSDSRRLHRKRNNRLLADTTDDQPPSLYPDGSEKKKRANDIVVYRAGPNVVSSTPISNYSSVSSLDNESKIDDMMQRVRQRAFNESGVLNIINVDEGCIESQKVDTNLYNTIQKKKEVARDIIGHTLFAREESTSLDCLNVVKPFIME